MPSVKLVECPRDAMQGWEKPISTRKKIAYINQLLKVGFDILDCGSFVSHRAIPQMSDTQKVIPSLQLNADSAKLLTIVANLRGAKDACRFDEISFLGFPFSISETFQLRNTNKTISQSIVEVEEMQNLCVKYNKKLLVYISMGFGNPYGDEYSVELIYKWFRRLVDLGVGYISLADTVGVGNPQNITEAFAYLVPKFPEIEIGGHFHSTPNTWQEKIGAAFNNGCFHFDSTIRGFGGCPMAEDELIGNIATENMIMFLQQKGVPLHLNFGALREAQRMADEIFV